MDGLAVIVGDGWMDRWMDWRDSCRWMDEWIGRHSYR